MPGCAVVRISARSSNACAAISPARRVANERLKRNGEGQVVLQLKSAWRDGTTHIVLSPLEFMQRLAALVPRPRLHLIRFHGVLAPNAGLRAAIVSGPPHKPGDDAAYRAPEAPARMGLSAVAQARVRYRPRTLLAVWRRLQDHRRHRRARRDGQDPHAPGPARARAAALTGAAAVSLPGGLIL